MTIFELLKMLKLALNNDSLKLTRVSLESPDGEVLEAVTQNSSATPELDAVLKRNGSTRNIDKENLKHLVFEAFKIAPTKLERTYPPVGHRDTRVGGKKRKAKETLSLALKDYANKNGINLPNPKNLILENQALTAQVATIFPHLKGLDPYGGHGYGNSYNDDAIVCIHPPIKEKEHNGVAVRFTNNEKPIIQQQATRGCTAGVAAMLIYEKTGKFNVSDLRMRNLGEDSTVESDFEKGGVPFLSTKCNSIEALQDRIEKHGSAIVTVNSIGGHVVIVDKITSQSVRIRGPYHGWEVDIERSAFEASWSKLNTVFQVA